MNQLTSREEALADEPANADELAASATAQQIYSQLATGLRAQRTRIAARYWRWRLERECPEALAQARDFASQFSSLNVGYRFAHFYSLWNRSRPWSVVVEAGSGVSTVFLAELLRRQERETGTAGRILSFEQDPEWFERLGSSFPSHLRSFVDLRLAPLRYERFGQWRGLFYEGMEQAAPRIDLLYIDGPTHPPDRRLPFFFMADAVRIERAHPAAVRYALTDKRHVNLVPFRALLGPGCRVRLSRTWRSVVFEPRAIQ
jgi:hypothetical protein